MSARILVVDDSASMRQMVAFALTSAGFDVDERTVRARPNNKGPRHTIWFAKKP